MLILETTRQPRLMVFEQVMGKLYKIDQSSEEGEGVSGLSPDS